MAHSDTARCFSYAGIDPFEFSGGGGGAHPASIDYSGTLRLTPVVEGSRTFAEGSVSFDSDPDDTAAWAELLGDLVRQWMDSLERTLDGRARSS